MPDVLYLLYFYTTYCLVYTAFYLLYVGILYTYLLIGFHMLCLVKDFITCT